MNPADIAAVDDHARVLRGLCREWLAVFDDPAQYCHDEGLDKPRGVTWVQWSEETREQLAADIAVRVRRLAERAGLTAVSR